MKKQCRVCGAEYESCYSCEKVNSWRTLTDTAEHYFILCVLMDYLNDRDGKKAYQALKKRGVDFKETTGFIPSVSALMEEIKAAGQTKSRVKAVAEVVPQEVVAEQSVADVPSVVEAEDEGK